MEIRFFDTCTDPDPALVGGKGYHLIKMTQAGVRVPPAAILGTDLCKAYFDQPEQVRDWLKETALPQVKAYLTDKLGYLPLISVRSGAPVSMPGMMDTILNVGLDDVSFPSWIERLGEDCAFNSYGRLVEMYGNVVNEIERRKFEGLSLFARLELYEKAVGAFPSADEQILGAVEAVFKSWHNDRAQIYRGLHGIPHDMGTAVVLQAMVFGNLNERSCTGVLFSRDPSTGANKVTGEFLVNAQGEDVVAGIRTPQSLDYLVEWDAAVAQELLVTVDSLEKMGNDLQDVEFTVQDGTLYILQTRKAKRTALATVKTAVDFFKEGRIDLKELCHRVALQDFLYARRPGISVEWAVKHPAVAFGLPASSGVATGKVVFSSAQAVACMEPCILVTEETTPEDIAGINAAVGILTRTGGATCHAAVVARSLDKVAVVGCAALEKVHHASWALNGVALKAGDILTLDGVTGSVWRGPVVLDPAGGSMELLSLLVKELGVVERVSDASQILLGDKVFLSTEIWNGLSTEEMTAKFQAVVDASKTLVVDLDYGKEDELSTLFGARTTGDKGKAWSKVKHRGKAVVWDQVPKLASLLDLLMAKGWVRADDGVLEEQLGAETLQKIVSLKAAAGEKIQSLVVEEQPSLEELSGPYLTAVTALQVAQSVLAH